MTVNVNPSGNGAAGSALLQEPIDYGDIKAWIEQQEANPKPLTPLQQRAIAELKRSLRSGEPEIGDRDWVSLLHLYRDAHQREGVKVSFGDATATPGDKWSLQCTLWLAFDGEPMTFPGPDAGFVPLAVDGDASGAVLGAPGFGRKKDAKKYAAKCCVEWLMAAGRMPSDGEAVVFKATGARSNGRVAAAAAGGNGGGSSSGSGSGGSRKVPAPPKQQPVDVYDDDLPATERVAELCRRLKIAVPRYEIMPADEMNCFFDGHPDFGVDSVKVPGDLGVVANVYTRRAARERIAEAVLFWLLKEDRRRQKDVEALLGEAIN